MRKVLLPITSALALFGFPHDAAGTADWCLAHAGQINESPADATGDPGRRAEFDYFEFLHPVFVDSNAPEFMQKAAKDLLALLGPRTMRPLMKGARKSQRGMGCVFDVKVSSFGSLAPPDTGYIIRIAYGGAVFEASDAVSAELAIAHLRRVAKRDGDKVLIPRGLLTNLQIVK